MDAGAYLAVLYVASGHLETGQVAATSSGNRPVSRRWV